MRIKKPRRLNLISFLLLCVGLAAVYAAVKFVPPYWRKYKVKGILDDAVHRYYRYRRVPIGELDQLTDPLRRETLKKIRAAGINPKDLSVEFKRTGRRLSASADYRERIDHWLVDKSTVLRFRPYATLDF